MNSYGTSWRAFVAAAALTVAMSAAGSGLAAGAESSTSGPLNARTSSADQFVRICGQRLCQGGRPFVIHGATGYGTYSEPDKEIALAKSAHVNTLAVVEFETRYHQLSDTTSAATWTRVDKYIAAAKAGGLHIVLTLSSYAQSLQKAGKTATTTDWQSYLSFIANRVNTVTGVTYKNDPTIAMVQLWGEICYPGESDSTCPPGTSGTAQNMIDFYHRTLTQWRHLAPNILASTGGFSHLDGAESSGIPWQTIVADSANPLCELEINSVQDATDAVGKVTAFCKHIGKPWYLAAWSSCYADSGYPFWLSNDQSMASHAQDMYNLQHGRSPSVLVALGSEFWNLRDKGAAAGHCDLSAAFPATFATIRSNA